MKLKRSLLLCSAIMVLIVGGVLAGTQSRDDYRDYDATNEEHFTSDLAGIERVRLANINGIMKLQVGSGDMIEIVMKEYARDGSRYSAQDLIDKINLKTERFGDELEIKADYEAFRDERMDGEYRGDFIVILPRRLKVDASTVNGDVEIPDMLGEVSASTVNGDVFIAGSEGKIDASTVNGDIEIQSVKEAMSASTVNGDISMKAAGELRGNLSLSTVSGDIEIDIPMGGDFRLKAETHSGKISGNGLELRNGRRTRRVNRTFGSGRYSMTMSTVSGDITLNR